MEQPRLTDKSARRAMERVVRARCVACNAKREIAAGEIPEGEHPLCHMCYSPMVPMRAALKRAERGKR